MERQRRVPVKEAVARELRMQPLQKKRCRGVERLGVRRGKCGVRCRLGLEVGQRERDRGLDLVREEESFPVTCAKSALM